MKKLVIGCLVGLSALAYSQEVVVYGPSSMKWVQKDYGKIFKSETGDTIKFISIDGLVGRMKLEHRNPKADIVIGMTELTTEQARKLKFIIPYTPKNITNITHKMRRMTTNFVVPIDYGYLGFNYNKEIKNPPKTLAEFKNFKKKLIVESPRLSITGSQTLQWSIALYGKNFMKFWQELKPAIYSVESGWSEAFAKFTANEAPMMVGYPTSNLFFTGGDANKYGSFIIDNGTYLYQEGASIINKKHIKKATYKFMDRILTDKFQNLVATKNYMFPVTDIALPSGFSSVPVPKHAVKLTHNQVVDLANNIDDYKNKVIDLLKK